MRGGRGVGGLSRRRRGGGRGRGGGVREVAESSLGLDVGLGGGLRGAAVVGGHREEDAEAHHHGEEGAQAQQPVQDHAPRPPHGLPGGEALPQRPSPTLDIVGADLPPVRRRAPRPNAVVEAHPLPEAGVLRVQPPLPGLDGRGGVPREAHRSVPPHGRRHDVPPSLEGVVPRRLDGGGAAAAGGPPAAAAVLMLLVGAVARAGGGDGDGAGAALGRRLRYGLQEAGEASEADSPAARALHRRHLDFGERDSVTVSAALLLKKLSTQRLKIRKFVPPYLSDEEKNLRSSEVNANRRQFSWK